MAYTLGNKCTEIVVNELFQFNVSSKTWSHIFFVTQYNIKLSPVNVYKIDSGRSVRVRTTS